MRSLIKKVLRESAHLKSLFRDLPSSLKRRITVDDLMWLDKELNESIRLTPVTTSSFKTFSEFVVSDLLHRFLVDVKDHEIETYIDPHYGETYVDDSLDKIGTIYFSLMPHLEKRYEIKLRQAFDKKNK